LLSHPLCLVQHKSPEILSNSFTSFLKLCNWRQRKTRQQYIYFILKHGLFLLFPTNMALVYPTVRLHQIYHTVDNR
jgi:hypothetical protein